ncbi:hypothetical protein D2E51_17565 [Mycobacteroides abscessus]|uniref:Uncharacterized protein n=1 Tax=Mycobacteroides abscessus TaxID=36809 RepID=A0AB33TES3_9MYCO|nr:MULTISPECIES: hypothetical protein [Mycobacteroides]RIS93657.1 hypothetical protein D2E51_17565 [Mycobacteroides abscessus]CPT67439.1 Uncharacterised protein [Mycobacteroides abscessus]CPT76671.1 Uncharacterised protein [Mycobacteroides abscessus]CPV17390.1 Uncharacterised protein [Mycobacteroides abscessus]CPW63330.1 Uncharacterised protein [Mycobacteroides abscessus]
MDTSSDEQEAARASVRRLARRRHRHETTRKRLDAEFYAAIKAARDLGVGATALARDAEVTRDGIYKICQTSND